MDANTALIPTKPDAWREVVTVWLNGKNSSRTRREYHKAVSAAMQTLGDFDQITAESLSGYRRDLMERMDREELSSSTVALRLHALRNFLQFASDVGKFGAPSALIARMLKPPKTQVNKPYHVLTDDERDALVANAGSIRNQSLLRLAVETGIRCDELVNVRIADFRTTETGTITLRIRKGKGNKVRDVPLSGRATEAVNALLHAEGRSLSDDGYLFASREGGHLDTSRVRQILGAARKAAGITKPISPHSLRHTAAIRWLRKSKNVNGVRRLLGHESLTTTTRYLDHVELDELQKIVE